MKRENKQKISLKKMKIAKLPKESSAKIVGGCQYTGCDFSIVICPTTLKKPNI